MSNTNLLAYTVTALALIVALGLLVKRCGGQRAAALNVPDAPNIRYFREQRKASGE